MFKAQYQISSANNSNKSIHVIIVIMLLACWPFAANINAQSKPEVEYVDGYLSIKRIKTPLLPLLKEISKITGIDVFVPENFDSVDVDIQINNQTLENSFDRILRGYNHALIFIEKGDSKELEAVKLVPEAKSNTSLISILTNEKVFKKKETLPSSQFAPRGIEKYTEKLATSLHVFRKQLEQKETDSYREFVFLKEQLLATKDPIKKKALAKIYADSVNKFQLMKRANFNKIEAIKRINLITSDKLQINNDDQIINKSQ